MNLSNNPFEVGFGKFMKLEEDYSFIGKDALRAIQEQGITQQLAGVVLEGDPIAANEHQWPVHRGDEAAGHLTSVVYSPGLEQNIGYVMTPIDCARLGTELIITTPQGAGNRSGKPSAFCLK